MKIANGGRYYTNNFLQLSMEEMILKSYSCTAGALLAKLAENRPAGETRQREKQLANNILGERFSETLKERKVTVIDTPGVVGTQGVGWERAELERHCEWLSCLVQCAPGPHALLLVMPVQRYTRQEQAVVEYIKTQFGEEMFRFTINTDILEFVEENTELAKLVQACGGRCHVVDNKYWTKDQQKEDPQRSNEFQVEAILNTVEKMVDENQKYLSNDALEQVEHDIQTEQSRNSH
ncbi:GTPase IMAP family member 7-like [Periophthalmus magnuspinnatus]|uniref:GTPase IMAP family member 7-like n=1 Tax=Periophthalmus magnuspinnatus TaxID=409849 RepID=UPI002436C4D9|nr:GTPase IMAP family member 7-like [Periophthalmus magnuspinnatus]